MNNQPPPSWLLKALSYLNTTEQKGKMTNPEIAGFFKDVGHSTIEDDEVPWCAAFVGAILEREGYASTRSLLARSYLNWGTPLALPKNGAIAVFERGSDPKAGHVGFVMGQSGDYLYILGGNQANRVQLNTYSQQRLLGLRWPGLKITKKTAAKSPPPSTAFKNALEAVLHVEGGWSNHPEDPGGATNYGITLGTYRHALNTAVITGTSKTVMEGLKTIPQSDVRQIYWVLYWQAAHCSELPEALAIVHFDAAVNHGVGRAIQFLQKTIGAAVDGEWGPETKARARKASGENSLEKYLGLRLDHYQSRPHFKTFGRGWLARLEHIRNFAKQHLKKTTSTYEKKEQTKMTEIESNSGEKWWAESLTVWGTLVTALATILPLVGPFIGLDITAEMVEELGRTVTDLIQIFAGLTGTTMALIGRARASAKITRRQMSVKL